MFQVNRSFTRRQFIQTTSRALAFGALTLSGGVSSFIVRAQNTARWQPLIALNDGPSPRMNQGMIYDPIGDRLIVFGGSGQGGFLNDVWAFSFENQRWTMLMPNDMPDPRRTPATLYDPHRHRMVTYAGQGAGFFNDTWAFDLDAQQWENLQGDPRPLPRYGTVFAYDPKRETALTFAGFTSEQGRFDDLWAFSFVTDQWQELSHDGIQPGKRCLHTSAYDVDQDRFFIYGGQRSGVLDDLWAFDPNTNTWREFNEGPRPSGRKFSAMVYDSQRSQMLIFGGRDAQAFGDLWSFNTQTERWSELQVADTSPESRDGHSAVWVPQRGMVIFGGFGQTVLNDLWMLSFE